MDMGHFTLTPCCSNRPAFPETKHLVPSDLSPYPITGESITTSDYIHIPIYSHGSQMKTDLEATNQSPIHMSTMIFPILAGVGGSNVMYKWLLLHPMNTISFHVPKIIGHSANALCVNLAVINGTPTLYSYVTCAGSRCKI